MARTKRAPSSAVAAESNSALPPPSASTWLQSSAATQPLRVGKCPKCGADFEVFEADELMEHDLNCDAPLPALEQDTALESTENKDIATTLDEPDRESSSNLTTPPDSPVHGPINEEDIAQEAVDPDSDSGSVIDQVNNDDHAAELAAVDLNDESEAIFDTLVDEENIIEPAILRNDLTSSVTAYVGEDLDFYDFEVVPAQTGNVSPDISESLATPELLSSRASETVEEPQVPDTSLPKTGAKIGFRKLTEAELIQQFLANPETMSYDMLYQRTEMVAGILKQYQDEYNTADGEVKAYMASIVPSKEDKLAQEKEAAKERLLEQEAVDSVLWRLHERYYAKLKSFGESEATKGVDTKGDQPEVNEGDDEVVATPIIDHVAAELAEGTGADDTETGDVPIRGRRKKPNDRAWKRYATDLLKAYPKDAHLSTQLAGLMHGTALKGLIERKAKRERPVVEAKPTTYLGLDLIDVPLPKLDEPKSKKRSLQETLEALELQKMSDVYGLPMVNGKVHLVDRNGDLPREGRNGRPVRKVREAKNYDTEQSEAPENSSDELPAKRRRVQASTAASPAPVSTARTKGPTAERPPQRIFEKSKKKCGRPRKDDLERASGSKVPKSKLKESHIVDSSPDDEKLQGQELPAKKEAELHHAVESMVDQTNAITDVPPVPKKGKHGGPRKKGVSTKNTAPVIAKPARGKRTKKELSEKFISLEEADVFPSTEHDDISRFASASVSRPTTSSSAATVPTSSTRRSTRQSTREQSKAPPAPAPKRKRNTASDTVEVAAPEIKEPAAKRRKGAKATPIPTPSTEPVTEDEISAPPKPPAKTRKRKTAAKTVTKGPRRVATHDGNGNVMIPYTVGSFYGDAVPAVEKDTEEDIEKGTEEENVKPATKSKATKRIGKKGEVVKPAAKPRRKARAETSVDSSTDELAHAAESEEGSESEPVKTTKKARRPAKAKASRKKKEPKVETPDEDLTEAELKAKQKSAKLSAATKKRWESGGMVGPMEKRKATNEAKRAEKKLAKTANTTTTAAETPAPTSASKTTHVPPPINTSANSSATRSSGSGTRTSGRKRKPTSRARALSGSLGSLGMDGANDSPSEDDSEEESNGGDEDEQEEEKKEKGRKVIHKRFKSEYEHFQALSSPGTPALPKRRSKQVVNLKQFIGSEDDEESDFRA